MAKNLGKKFEARFLKDWLQSMPDSDGERLYDPGFGMKGISNISDFICYSYPYQYYIECKTIKGNTFPFTNLKQYKKLIEKCPTKGTRRGVIIWFNERDKVVYVPIIEIEKMKSDGKKSVNIKMLNDNNYHIIDIASKKLRTMMESDYSILNLSLQFGE